MEFKVNVTSEDIQCETFDHKGEMVILLRFLSETLSDEDEEKIIEALRSFVSFQKKTPRPYHIIIDTHKVLVFPVDRIITIYNYINRKEKYLRQHAISTSYLIQGKVAELALQTLNGMFDTWTINKTFQCLPTANRDRVRGIPSDMFSQILEFIDTSAPPTVR